MKQKATITIKGKAGSDTVDISLVFDPILSVEDEANNAAASTAITMVQSIRGNNMEGD